MFLYKNINTTLYKGQKIFNGDDDIRNAIAYCFRQQEWDDDLLVEASIPLSGCSSNFLSSNTRLSPEEIYDTINYNHKVYEDNRGDFIKHRVISFDASDLLIPEDLTFLSQYLANWYSSRGHFTVFGVHTNTDNLHIHLMIDSVNYLNGNRFKMPYEYYLIKDLLTVWYISFYQFLLSNPREVQRRLERLNKTAPFEEEDINITDYIHQRITDAIRRDSYLKLSADDDDYYKAQWPYFFTQNGGSL